MKQEKEEMRMKSEDFDAIMSRALKVPPMPKTKAKKKTQARKKIKKVD